MRAILKRVLIPALFTLLYTAQAGFGTSPAAGPLF